MHARTISLLQHDHNFAVINKRGERRTKIVLLLSLITMLLEIGAGFKLESMALLADGWHMGTHSAAFLITLVAYRYSRAHRHDNTFAFSPGKVGVLGAFASSIALGIAAFLMLAESVNRLLHPHVIRFDEAIAIAGVGLGVNLICALLLKDHHGHEHGKTTHHEHKGGHHHHDHNLKAAYLHVLADALTSVLAIAALSLGKFYGWHWLDPVMGMVGSIIITRWSYSLVKETSPILLDESINSSYRKAIIDCIEGDADNRIADLHIWRVAPNHFAVIVSIVTHYPKEPDYYRKLLKKFNTAGGMNKLSHITVEITRCTDSECPRNQ